MGTQCTPTTVSRGRVLAFRIIAGILAVFVIVSNIAFSVPQFFSETDKVHSFHDLAAMPAFLILLGFALIVMALRPDDVVALRVAWAVALGMVIAGVIGHDFISGSYFFNVIVTGGSAGSFLSSFTTLASLADLVIAIVKAAIFGWLAAIVGSYKGLSAGGGPSGVGRAVNEAVIVTFMLLFFINALITAVYFQVVPQQGL